LGANLGCEVRSVGRDDDLAAAVSDADAIVHLTGNPPTAQADTYPAAKLSTALATGAALAGSRAQRLVFLSFITARLGSTNSCLRL
jgi:hypothetical protein